MSASIDERIVAMKFDNKEFERNAQTSMTTLDKLKQKLNFSDVQNKLGQIDTSSLKKSFNGIGDIDTSKMSSVLDRLEYRMSNFGIFTARFVENIADSVYGIVSKAMAGLDKIVTYAETGIVQGGYTRASNIQTAKFQLEGVGVAWGDIFKDIDYAVTNTAYSLDQAALVASQLASAGLKPGTQYVTSAGEERDIDTMAMILKSISGTAAQSGGRASYSRIGEQFIDILSRGKVYATDMNEIAKATGIGVKDVLVDYMNEVGYEGRKTWTVEAIDDLTGKGEFKDPMIVIEALYERFGEHAGKANETLSGVMANTKSALARIGENFFTPIIENGGPLVKLFEVLRKSINDVNKTIKPIVSALGGDVADKIKSIVEKFATVDEEGNVTLNKEGGIFSSWFEPAKYIDNVYSIGDGGVKTYHYETYLTRAEVFAENIRTIFNNLWDIAKNIGSGISDVFHSLFPNYQGMADIITKLSTKIAEATTRFKEFTDNPSFKDSLFFKFIRAIGAGIDIIFRFGKSFKQHILDPIFNKGAKVIKDSGVGDWFKDFLDNIFEFDQKLKEKGNEDYFGPFLENMKQRFRDIKDGISNFLSDIVDWWRPVKDILFDTDLSFGDKLRSIKDYFSENFKLPGWERAKDIFEGIHDAISKAINKIRDFLGINKKEETLELTTASQGYAGAGGFGGTSAYLNTIDSGSPLMAVGKLLGDEKVKETLEGADKNTSLLSKIADGIGNIFSSIKETFSSIDVDGFKITVLAVIGVFVLLAAGIVWTVAKIIGALSTFAVALPIQLSRILGSFNALLRDIAGMFRAEQFKIYTEGLQNLSQAVLTLTLIFTFLWLLIGLIKKFDENGEMESAMKWAIGIISGFTALLGGILAGVSFLTKDAKGASVGINKEGANLTMPSKGLAGLSNFLKAFSIALATVVGLTLVVGYIWTRDGGKEVLLSGAVAIALIGLGIYWLINALTKAINRSANMPGLDGKQWVAGMMSIGAILTGLAIALAVMVPAIIILGLLPLNVLLKGAGTLAILTVVLGGVAIGLIAISTKLSKAEGIKDSKIAMSIFGVAAIISAVSMAMVALTVAMIIISRLEWDQIGKGLITLVAIGAILVAIPGILMLIFSKIAKGNINAGIGIRNGKSLLGLAAVIAALGVAVLAISIAFKMIDKLENTAESFGYLFGIIGMLTLLTGVLSAIKVDNLDAIRKTVMAIGAVIVALTVTLIILSHNLSMELLIAAGIMFVELAAFVGAVFLMSAAVEKFGKGKDMSALAGFAKAVALLSLALIPMALALSMLFAVVSAFNMEGDQMVGASVALGLALAALAFIAGIMVTKIPVKDGSEKDIKSMMRMIEVLSLAMIAIAASMALVILALNVTKFDGAEAFGIMLGFALVITAFGYTVNVITKGLSAITHTGSFVLSALSVVLVLIAPIIGAAMGMALLISAVTKSGISTSKLIAVAGILLGMVVIPAALVILLNKFNALGKDGLMEIGVYAGVLLTVALSLAIAANGIVKIAKAGSKSQIAVATLCLAAMGIVVSVITTMLAKIKAIGNIGTAVRNVISFAGVCVGMVVLAKAMQMLSTFKFESIRANLVALGVVTLIALGIAALVGLVPGMASGALSAAGLLLSLAATMAGVGLGLYLTAQALSVFIDTVIELDEKADQVKGGVINLFSGLVDGFLESFKYFNTVLPEILTELGKFFNELFTWLEVEIPALLRHLHEILKSVLIEVCDFVNDEEVQVALSGIITGLLQFIIDNAETWTEKLVILGEKIIQGVIKGLEQALPALGQYIDENVLGGSIDKMTSWLADGVSADAFVKGWNDSYKMVSDTMVAMIKKMGYTSKQVKELMDNEKTNKMADAAIQVILGAEYFGTEEYKNKIAEHGGVSNFLGYIIDAMIKEAGMEKTALRKAAEDFIAFGQKSFVQPIIDDLFNMSTMFDKSDSLYWDLSNAGGLLHQALIDGWDTDEGKSLRQLAADEIIDAINATNDSDQRALLYKYAHDLGIELPTGFEDGTEEKETERTINNFIKTRVLGPLSKWVTPTATYAGTIGFVARQNLLSAFAGGDSTEPGSGYGLGFDKVLTDSWTALREANTKESHDVPLMMQNDWWSASSTMGNGLASALTPQMVLAGNKSWAAFQAVNAALAMIPQTYRPAVNYIPNVTVSSISMPEGTINTIGGIFQAKLKAAFGTSSNFVYTGEMITSGILTGMTDTTSQKNADNCASRLITVFDKAIRKRFGIKSPAKAPEVLYEGQMISAGQLVSIQNSFDEGMPETANSMADTYGTSMESAFDDVDVSSIGTKLKDSLTSKLPSWDSIKSNFGWEKGLSGNLEGVKNVWNQLKSTFSGDDGSGGLGGIFGGIGDIISEKISGLTSGLSVGSMSLEDMGFDLTSAGVSLDIDSGFDFTSFEQEFAGFDINDMVDNNNLEMTLDVNTDMFDEFMKENRTLDMATSTPIYGGYSKSTLGSTYVNNYNYNQTNNSPVALSSREIRRQTELELNRRQRGGGFRPV